MDRQPTSRPPTRIPRLASRLPIPSSTSAISRSDTSSPSSARLKADPGLDLSRFRRPTEEHGFSSKQAKAPSDALSRLSLNGSDQNEHSSEEAIDSSENVPPSNPVVKTKASSGVRNGRNSATQVQAPPPSPRSSDTLTKTATQTRRNVKKPQNQPELSPKPSSPSRRPLTPAKSPAEPRSDSEPKKSSSKTSSALRETIARAKAARRAEKTVPQTRPAHDLAEGDFDDIGDPFNQQQPKENAQLHSRLDAARTSGSLNIAAMNLKELPSEMLTMYDADASASSSWYEAVDLVRLVAADNELTELPDEVFPDIDPEEFDVNAEDRGNQFGGLQVIDLRRNSLRSLPIGFRKLRRLRALNLSNNQLHMDDLAVIMEIESLSDLKLANNHLQGSLTRDIGHLHALEVLDVRGNGLTDLPGSLAELSSLKFLNVDENQLTSLPWQSLSRLPLLRDLTATSNKLTGTLIPSSVSALHTLQFLNVASNALDRLSEEDTDFANLRTLSVGSNRITRLPDMSSWHELLNLSAEDNDIQELPRGLVDLKRIKIVDLASNSISRLDDRIGLMESLTLLRIAGNPIRERKFLNMGTEEIKRDLKNRYHSEVKEAEDDEDGHVATAPTLMPEGQSSNGWQVRPGGILDRSHAGMKEFDEQLLVPVVMSETIRRLYLQRNSLRNVPIPSLNLVASTLLELDLSHNPLDTATCLTGPLTLPHLQRLNLSTTGLTSLSAITTNLSAPCLAFLDVSCNRISGNLPTIRQTYPKMLTLLAADNRITGLEFEAVQGLQAVDVTNNEINFLPPKIGLLRAEGLVENRGGGSALMKLEVTGNTFKVPRWQTVTKGTEAILEWLKNRIAEDEICELEP